MALQQDVETEAGKETEGILEEREDSEAEGVLPIEDLLGDDSFLF